MLYSNKQINSKMAISDDIFQLIKSMNRAEKAYSRRYLKMHSAGKNSSLLQLFEAIEKYSGKEDAYDEAELKKSPAIKKLHHLPVLKNNLYNILADSLYEYSSGILPEEKVIRLMKRFDVLYSKSLLKQCESVLKKAKKIASENELLQFEYLLLSREKTLSRYIYDVNSYRSAIEKIYTHQSKVIEKITNITEFNYISGMYIALQQQSGTGFTREESETDEKNRLFANPLLQDEKNAITKTSKRTFYTCRIMQAQHEKDYEKAFEYCYKKMCLDKEDARQKKVTIHSFIISVYSTLVFAIRTKRFTEFDKIFLNFKDIEQNFHHATDRDRMESFYYGSVMELSVCSATLNLERGIECSKKISNNFDIYDPRLAIQQKIILIYFLSAFYFINCDNEKTVKWLNRLISIPGVDLSEDYQCYARIMNVIVHYELGYYDSLEYVLKSAYHFLSRRKKVYKYEKIILDYMRKSFRVRTDNELIEMFVFMRKDLDEIKNDEFEQNAFDAFNIMPWLDSKIENIPFIDAIRKNGTANS